MQLFTIVFERLPMVWILLGLLFNALGLYVGFDNSLSFVYMIVGWACCAYGLAIYVLRLLESPKTSAASKLSPNFISVGSADMTPAVPSAENEQVKEQSNAE